MGLENGIKKVWIDLDNSPHVLFFDPIIKELKRREIQVLVTARDYAQVCGLAELFNIKYKKVGRHHGKFILFKAIGVLTRSAKLLAMMWREKPDLAFSHGSRSQVISSKLLGIPSVVAFDYEGAKGLPFITPSIAVVPEVVYQKLINMKMRGVTSLLNYPGIKEDVYVPSFKPDKAIINDLNIKSDDVVVIVRPPATLAHYHNSKSEELFDAIIKTISQNARTRIFILPRTKDQEQDIKSKWPELFNISKIIIPSKVINGLNLIWHSDLVISGGGTMIREAAALNIPAYSFFQGEIGAVDKYLEAKGRLVLINNLGDIKDRILLRKAHHNGELSNQKSSALKHVIELVENILYDQQLHSSGN